MKIELFPAAMIGLMLGACGFLLGSMERPQPTEMQMARQLAGGEVRLIGLGCQIPDGNGFATVIAHEEDFGLPCKEIRRLEEEQS